MQKANKLTGKKLQQVRNESKLYKGVSTDIGNPNKPFKATFYNEGTSTHLGYFPTALEAAQAYNKMSKNILRTVRAAKNANKWNEIV